MNIEESLKRLEDALQDLEKNVNNLSEDEEHKFLQIVEDILGYDWSNQQNVNFIPKVYQHAVSLWNIAVIKTKGGVPNVTNAKLKQAAFMLINLGTNDDPNAQLLSRKTTMALKTARSWLDLEQPDMTVTPFAVAAECIEKREEQMKQQEQSRLSMGDMTDAQQTVLDITSDKFKLLAYQAEALAAKGSHEQAVGHVVQAKDLLYRIPRETGFLCMLCYNCGVTSFRQGQFDVCTIWLRHCYELGKNAETVKSKTQARTLRLLAKAYLEHNAVQNWKVALNAIGLANAEHPHPTGLFIRLQILLLGKEGEATIQGALDDLLNNPELTIDTAITAANLLTSHNNMGLALTCLQQLRSKFKEPDLAKIDLVHINILLKSGRSLDAKKKAEELLGCDKKSHLNEEITSTLETLLWDQAISAYEGKFYSEALEWFELCGRLFENQTNPNIGKLYRNKATCCLELGQLQEAASDLEVAVTHDPTAPYLHYLKYRLALKLGNTQDAKEAITAMSEAVCKPDCALSREHVLGLVSLAAQQAHQQENRALTVESLEMLTLHTRDTAHALVILRCLTRLRLTNIDQDSGTYDFTEFEALFKYIEQAYNNLAKEVQTAQGVSTVDIDSEAAWFRKIGWNAALKCQGHHLEMSRLFSTCCKLHSISPTEDIAVMNMHKKTLLMSASSCLCAAKETVDPKEKLNLASKAVEHSKNCRQICKQIQTLKKEQEKDEKEGTADADVKILKIAILCECEAQVIVGERNVEYLINEGHNLDSQDCKMFENLAAIGVLGGSPYFDFSIKCLKVAIKRYLQSEKTNFQECSKAFHSLIDIAMKKGPGSDPKSKEEVWGYFQHLCEVLEDKAKGRYPEVEVACLVGKAWNCGIHLYTAGKLDEGLQWCKLAMHLVKHLTSLENNYKEHMNTIFAELKKPGSS